MPAPDPATESPVQVFQTSGAIDSMSRSHDGRLLLAGIEDHGRLMIFRTEGDPGPWRYMNDSFHGGRSGWAVNSLDTRNHSHEFGRFTSPT